MIGHACTYTKFHKIVHVLHMLMDNTNCWFHKQVILIHVRDMQTGQ